MQFTSHPLSSLIYGLNVFPFSFYFLFGAQQFFIIFRDWFTADLSRYAIRFGPISIFPPKTNPPTHFYAFHSQSQPKKKKAGKTECQINLDNDIQRWKRKKSKTNVWRHNGCVGILFPFGFAALSAAAPPLPSLPPSAPPGSYPTDFVAQCGKIRKFRQPSKVKCRVVVTITCAKLHKFGLQTLVHQPIFIFILILICLPAVKAHSTKSQREYTLVRFKIRVQRNRFI